MTIGNEQRYYDTLRRIAKEYHTSDRLQRDGEKLYGVTGDEALAMSYDNIQEEAKRAIHGRRRPKEKKP